MAPVVLRSFATKGILGVNVPVTKTVHKNCSTSSKRKQSCWAYAGSSRNLKSLPVLCASCEGKNVDIGATSLRLVATYWRKEFLHGYGKNIFKILARGRSVLLAADGILHGFVTHKFQTSTRLHFHTTAMHEPLASLSLVFRFKLLQPASCSSLNDRDADQNHCQWIVYAWPLSSYPVFFLNLIYSDDLQSLVLRNT